MASYIVGSWKLYESAGRCRKVSSVRIYVKASPLEREHVSQLVYKQVGLVPKPLRWSVSGQVFPSQLVGFSGRPVDWSSSRLLTVQVIWPVSKTQPLDLPLPFAPHSSWSVVVTRSVFESVILLNSVGWSLSLGRLSDRVSWLFFVTWSVCCDRS